MNWIEAIAKYDALNQAFVLVTILQSQGSAPRDSDAKMVVAANACHDTIGGGQLEFKAVEEANSLLIAGQRQSLTREFNLSKDLEQCCGGLVTLLFECFPSNAFQVVLFGAGHVGTALAGILAQLPCRLSWFDSRQASIEPGQTKLCLMHSAEQAVESCEPGSCYIVMTHSHSQDQDLIEAILARGDSRYCGLIGSKSKIASFRGRLARKGFTEQELAQLTAPIGITGIAGKVPMEIAVSVAAQLLQLHGAKKPQR